MIVLLLIAFLTFIQNSKYTTCDKLDIKNQLEFGDLVFIILSQDNTYHEKQALNLELDIAIQTHNKSNVYLTHRDFKHIGDWTIVPILDRLWKITKGKFSWMIFLNHQTKVNVQKLVSLLEKHNYSETFIGRGLSDLEPTIIHHFASITNFQYPLFSAGFAMNHLLLERLMNLFDIKYTIKKSDFSIDAAHELALFLKNNLGDISLINSSKFCLEYTEDCVSHVSKSDLCEEVDIKNVFFAIKTCEKFHNNRVKIVQTTWGKKCHNILYFSDVLDESIPTIKVNVPNTDHGHCNKSEAILQNMKQLLAKNKKLEWVVLADDDTILSVSRIQRLVGCYKSDEPLIIGERYGYNVFDEYGYNYITGGGGVVLSREAVMKLSGNCACPSITTPDDMYLFGICARRLNIKLVHIPLFHQARPSDYSQDYLKIGDPISFHKHWMTDPVEIYKAWFQETDKNAGLEMHSEL